MGFGTSFPRSRTPAPMPLTQAPRGMAPVRSPQAPAPAPRTTPAPAPTPAAGGPAASGTFRVRPGVSPAWNTPHINPYFQAADASVNGSAPQAPAASMSEFSSSVGDNPDLRWLADKYKSRFDTSNTKRAIDASTLGIMDAAALGAADAKGAMASRGVLGTGTGASFLQKRVFQPAQRAAAGAAKDIALDEQHRLDALTLGGLGIMKAPADLALGQNAQALQQWMAANGFNLQNQQLAAQQQAQQFAQQQQQWQNMLQLMQMGNPYGGPTPAAPPVGTTRPPVGRFRN